MSDPPQAPSMARLLTKKSPRPWTGVGQKSLAVELIGEPRFWGAPQGAFTLWRCATQMSRSVRVSPAKRGLLEAIYRLSPSGDWIGQPSSEGVFSSLLVPGTCSALIAGAQGEKPGIAWAAEALTAEKASTARTRALVVMVCPLGCGSQYLREPTLG